MQQNDAFQSWAKERSTIEAEMDVLFRGDLIVAPGDRQVRKIRFMALIEQRNAAARRLLESLPRSPALFPSEVGSPVQECLPESQEIPREGDELAPQSQEVGSTPVAAHDPASNPVDLGYHLGRFTERMRSFLDLKSPGSESE